MDGRYIYCISNLEENQNVDVAGILGSPVSIIRYKDIGAYVSSVPFEELKTDIQTIETHQRVVELSRSRASTLPVKFGVIFKSEDGVKALLSKSYDEYKSKLKKFRNKDEYGLKVLIAGTDSRKRPDTSRKVTLKKKPDIGEGTLYFQKLREDERKRSEELMKWDKLRSAIRQELSEHAEQQALLNSDLPQILLNAAYLVDRSKESAFISSVGSVRMRYEPEGVKIHVSGPWAPYSFC